MNTCSVNMDTTAPLTAAQANEASDWFDAYVLGQEQPPSVQYWQVRRVGPDLCVNHAGRRWSAAHLDGVAVGDLVAVQADSNPTGAPLLSAGHAPQPGTWASQPAPAHSCPHSGPTAGTAESWGSQPTGCGSASSVQHPLQHAPGMPAQPPAANPQGHSHSHSAGTAGGAPAADSISKMVALAHRLAHEHGSPGTGKSLVSVSLHFSRGGVE